TLHLQNSNVRNASPSASRPAPLSGGSDAAGSRVQQCADGEGPGESVSKQALVYATNVRKKVGHRQSAEKSTGIFRMSPSDNLQGPYADSIRKNCRFKRACISSAESEQAEAFYYRRGCGKSLSNRAVGQRNR